MKAAALLLVPSLAFAEEPVARPRGFHGSLGVGGALVLIGNQGDLHRPLEVSLDVKPWSRWGVSLGWRAVEPRDNGYHRGLATVGVVYEGAAARPRLVLDIHVDAGADLDAKAPLVGGGIRTTFTIYGPLGVVLDSGAYLVIDGIDDSRLHFQTSTLLAARW